MSTWTLQDAAKVMRRNPTASEAALWERLRGRRLGVKFRRQHVVGRSIADFACLEAGLIVEVDGPIHADAAHRLGDPERDANLGVSGFETYRVTSERVLTAMDEVLEELEAVLRRRLFVGGARRDHRWSGTRNRSKFPMLLTPRHPLPSSGEGRSAGPG